MWETTSVVASLGKLSRSQRLPPAASRDLRLQACFCACGDLETPLTPCGPALLRSRPRAAESSHPRVLCDLMQSPGSRCRVYTRVDPRLDESLFLIPHRKPLRTRQDWSLRVRLGNEKPGPRGVVTPPQRRPDWSRCPGRRATASAAEQPRGASTPGRAARPPAAPGVPLCPGPARESCSFLSRSDNKGCLEARSFSGSVDPTAKGRICVTTQSRRRWFVKEAYEPGGSPPPAGSRGGWEFVVVSEPIWG